jgi:chaperonin GroES
VASPSEGVASVRRLTGEAQQSIRMTADRILVVPPTEMAERRSRGGILIPATAESEAKRAIWAESAFEVEIRQEDYLVLRERDIHAVASKHTESNTGLYL